MNKQKECRGKSEGATGAATRKKLAGTPFKTASELNKASDDVLFSVWRELEEAKALDLLLAKEEYEFWYKPFEDGITCIYGEERDNLFKIFASRDGVKVSVNEDMIKTLQINPSEITLLIKSLNETFANTYFRAIKRLPSAMIDLDKVERVDKVGLNR